MSTSQIIQPVPKRQKNIYEVMSGTNGERGRQMQYPASRYSSPPSRNLAPYVMFRRNNNRCGDTQYPPRLGPGSIPKYRKPTSSSSANVTYLSEPLLHSGHSQSKPIIEGIGVFACGYNNHPTAAFVRITAKKRNKNKKKTVIRNYKTYEHVPKKGRETSRRVTDPSQ